MKQDYVKDRNEARQVQATLYNTNTDNMDMYTSNTLDEEKEQGEEQEHEHGEEQDVLRWRLEQVCKWGSVLGQAVQRQIRECELDGPSLLCLDATDFTHESMPLLKLGERKRLYLKVIALQRRHRPAMKSLGLLRQDSQLPDPHTSWSISSSRLPRLSTVVDDNDHDSSPSRPASEDGRASRLKPEIWKAFLSLCYAFLVTWVTAVVMVIVHDKVPDMKKYPPLPDLFLDNVPHIPWAFDMCEITGSILMAIWICVLLFHKHRFILLRRFFSLSGTVFLLRCVTMLITSLSVPGGHLKCAPRHYPSDVEPFSNWSRRLSQAYTIWTGAGMSVRGVRTCGDYMFSGHTVALTLLNFFITEYTSRGIYLLHIITWLMNMFGIFFILAAHEHYSIDVFIAFYISSRLFLYYHTLSNNQALMQGDSTRTRIWFPMLSFFESEVDGIVPNEYENPLRLLVYLKIWIVQLYFDIRDSTTGKMLQNSLNQKATEADVSVTRFVDNIKRKLSTTANTTGTSCHLSKKILLIDKNVQASLSNDSYINQRHPSLSMNDAQNNIFSEDSEDILCVKKDI